MRALPLLLTLALAVPGVALPADPSRDLPTPTSAPGLAAAHQVLDSGDFLGHTPQGWIDWADGMFHRAPSPGLPGIPLAQAVRAAYAAAGVAADDTQLAALDQQAAALEPGIAMAFAPLVVSVAQAYERQRVLAAQVDMGAIEGPPEVRIVLPPAAARAGVANAERLVGAAEAFRQAVAALPEEQRGGGFRDPLGLIVLGTSGPDVFEPDGVLGDPMLLADPGGDDIDHTAAGGACPLIVNLWADCNGLALALRVDVGGSDLYHFTGQHGVAQGSGAFGGLGVLVDTDGDDTYLVQETAFHGSSVAYYINGVVQGSGEGGNGLLIDTAGSDLYRFEYRSPFADMFPQGQGFAGLGGTGALLDGEGNDRYETDGRCTRPSGSQFCGLYVQGTGLYPGVAIIYDAAGDDAYSGVVVGPQEDYYSQGFAAFGALAIQVDQAGDDTYLASATSTRPNLAVSLNCAFGSAEYGGAVAVFLDAAGSDSYIAETYYSNPPYTMAEGFSLGGVSLYWDVTGNDYHSMLAIGPSPMLGGRGDWRNGQEVFALYLDTGGDDVYQDVPAGQAPGADNAQWLFGIDADLF